MKKTANIVLFSMVIAFIALSSPASADSPIQVAILNPIQIVNEVDDVKGIRLNAFYGVNDSVSGFDFGFVNRTTHEQKGLQIGFFNMTENMSGLQIGLFNRTEWLNGIQIGFLNMSGNGYRELLPLVNFSF